MVLVHGILIIIHMINVCLKMASKLKLLRQELGNDEDE